MSLLNAWRLPLRMARRDALRHRARSTLVLVMIALPVLAVTAADVVMNTSQVSGAESLERRMGAAQALITVQAGVDRVEHAPDPDEGFGSGTGSGSQTMPGTEEVASLLGGARLLELRTGDASVGTGNGVANAQALEVDLQDPLTRGLVELTSGRLPRAADEVVVNQALADKGYAVGEVLDLREREGEPDLTDPRIVGVAESAVTRTYPFAAGPIGSLGASVETQSAWLADGGPISWATVRQLNDIGATVASRAVILDPPPASEVPDSVYGSGTDDTTIAVLALIVVMALIEVVLLAGPAFAVGARKQQRSLALLAATGGTPAQSRRVVISGALVLGSLGAAAGVVIGLGIAWAALPLLQSMSDTWFGPFDVPWLHLLGIAGFGLLSAFLAALVPASIASRQDVVAVLAGRRGDRAPSLRSPLLGLVLLGAGVAGSAYGAVNRAGGELVIAASAIPAVLGMILLVPVVLAGLARVSGGLPLVLRYAVRDADRHRTRTVPAVAAVAATVAGVVALGVGLSSDEAQNRGTYVASLVEGVGIVSAYDPEVGWGALRGVVEREVPDAAVVEQRGLPETDSFTEIFGPGGEVIQESWGDSLGASIMVSDDTLPVGLLGIAARDVAPAEQALREGGVVVFVAPGRSVEADHARIVRSVYDPDTGEPTDRQQHELPAYLVTLAQPHAGPAAVFSSAAVRAVGAEPAVVSLAIVGGVSEDEEESLNEGLRAISDTASIYVERGYQLDDAVLIIQLILVGLGGVLMLGGTLTATFLALSDARPDLATLAAVGASPRSRRLVAAAYAVVVGMVGAALGTAVGFIPGIAVSFPLTAQNQGGADASGPFLDIPWLMILGLVVALPLLTALVVGLFARSRLPLVARLD